MAVGASGSVSISIRISGENKASGALKQASTQVSGIEKAAKSAQQSLRMVGLQSAISLAQQFGSVMKKAWDFAAEGEKANRIQTQYNTTVAGGVELMNKARIATQNSVDDTTLQRRLIALGRTNLSLDEQVKLLENVSRIVKTSGDTEDTVYRKAIGALEGRKTSLKDYGIIIKDATNALGEMSAAVSNVKLDGMDNGIQRLTTSWDNFVSNVQQGSATIVNAGLAYGPALFNDKAKAANDNAMAFAVTQDRLAAALEESARTGEASTIIFARMSDEADKVAATALKDWAVGVGDAFAAARPEIVAMNNLLEQTARNIAAASLVATLDKFDAALKKKFGAPKRRRRGGGGRRRDGAAQRAAEDTKALAAAAAIQRADEDATITAQQRIFEIQTARLGVMEASGVQVREQAMAMKLQQATAAANLELSLQRISADEAAHRIQVAQLDNAREANVLALEAAEIEAAANEAAFKKADTAEIEAAAEALDKIKDTLADVAAAAATSENDIVKSVGRMAAAFSANYEAIAGGGPGAIAAIGKVAAAGIESAQAQAVIQGLFETAASIASFASQDYLSGALHAVSAGMYFAVAGSSSGGASAGAGAGAAAGARSTPTATASQPQEEAGARSVVVNINAPLVAGSTQAAGAQLGAMVRDAQRSGFAA